VIKEGGKVRSCRIFILGLPIFLGQNEGKGLPLSQHYLHGEGEGGKGGRVLLSNYAVRESASLTIGKKNQPFLKGGEGKEGGGGGGEFSAYNQERQKRGGRGKLTPQSDSPGTERIEEKKHVIWEERGGRNSYGGGPAKREGKNSVTCFTNPPSKKVGGDRHANLLEGERRGKVFPRGKKREGIKKPTPLLKSRRGGREETEGRKVRLAGGGKSVNLCKTETGGGSLLMGRFGGRKGYASSLQLWRGRRGGKERCFGSGGEKESFLLPPEERW